MAQTQHWQPDPVRPLDAVEATLNYLAYTGERPVSYAARSLPNGGRPDGPAAEPHRVRIRNARRLSEAPRLDRNGFQLLAHRTRVSSFNQEEAIRNEYYPEAIDAIVRATGAAQVVIFDHTLRSAKPNHGEPGIREPGNRVHNDQTFVSGPRRVRDHLPPDEAEARLQKRHAIVNFWRPIAHPVGNWPLAMCDAQSISPSDLIPTDLVYPEKVGETYSFIHNPGHRWFYYPDQSPDEVLLLKIYDSRTDGTARLTAHTAFDDPSSKPGSPPRRSIELRTLVFWDE
jgi:hypothetical protein